MIIFPSFTFSFWLNLKIPKILLLSFAHFLLQVLYCLHVVCVSHKHRSGVRDTKLYFCCCMLLDMIERKDHFAPRVWYNPRVTILGKIVFVASLYAWSPNKVVYTCRFVATRTIFPGIVAREGVSTTCSHSSLGRSSC
jgi:hypothetical protein